MIHIRFTADPIPPDFQGTLQDYQDRFLLNLHGHIEDTQVLTGQIGGARPTQDVGPWFSNDTWHSWNGSEYVPATVKVGGAGYVVQLGDYTSVGDGVSNPLPNRIQTLQDKDGTVALLDDVYVGRPPVVLSGTTPVIDWNLGHHFVEVLPGNTTFRHINSKPGQRIVLLARNNTTSYTTTFAPTPAIFWPAGTAPSQTALKTDMYIFDNIAGSILGRQVPNY
jgi:hypothetical protein